MKFLDIFQIILFLITLTGLAPFLGNYMAKVFSGEKHFLDRTLGRTEHRIYRMTGVVPVEEMNWRSYASGLIIFNFWGFLILFLLQLTQKWLPLNPQNLGNVSWHSALNTAVSFMTNTNLQGYAGETTMSYLVQILGLTVQNFLSAATGMAVFMVLIRGIVRKTTDKLGNFWVDLTRSVLFILLPLSLVLAIILTGQGVIQNFRPYVTAHGIDGTEQVIPMGPAASQVAIKQLGTNGGGFFNANSAHPFENPTPLSDFLEMLAILLIPASLTYTYGRMVGSTRHGWVIFLSMLSMFLIGLAISLFAEFSHYNGFEGYLLMEGKETRFGITNSILWSTSTTAASSGSVNAMLDSLSPLAGMIAMVNMMLGEIIFGGVGAGMYGMVIFIILTVFIAGLMVGRTPEYLGKKIESFEIQMSVIAVLIPSLVILIFSAIASSTNAGRESLNNDGPHGLSEIIYAFSSAAGNNGSTFAGLTTNTVFYDLSLGAGMLLGRFGVIIPVLAVAGRLAGKKITPPSAGTFRTDNLLFAILLVSVILIIGGLTFFPALSLGPVIEHLLLNNAATF